MVKLAAMALKDVESFYQRISSRMERRYLADASEMEKERERLEARNREIDDMFLNLYTDKAKGILSEQRFVKLTAAMEREQEENQKQLKELARSCAVPMSRKVMSAPLSGKSGSTPQSGNWTRVS